MDQQNLILIAQTAAGQQSVLGRSAHVQAGDDVDDFCQGTVFSFSGFWAQIKSDGPMIHFFLLNLKTAIETKFIRRFIFFSSAPEDMWLYGSPIVSGEFAI